MPPTPEESSTHFELLKWLGGAVLTVTGWAVHRYRAIFLKMDRISEDVAVLTVHIERNRDELDQIHATLEKMQEKMDRRRKDDPRQCIIKDYADE